MDSLDDLTLIQRAPCDPTAFGELYNRYIDRVYAYAYRRLDDRAMAEDVTAATFEKALKNIGRFRWQGVGVAAWLYRIAHNECVNVYRQNKRLTDLADDLPTIEAAIEDDDLRHALNQLTEADWRVLELRFLEDLPSATVAEMLGCTVNALYVRLHRSLARLRQALHTPDKPL